MQPDKEEIRQLIEKEIEKTRDRIAEYEEMAQPISFIAVCCLAA